METPRDNYHFSNSAPTHKHTVTNCIELSKLLRAACLFLSRPDCYPQRQTGGRSQRVQNKNSLNGAIWSNSLFCSLSRELSRKSELPFYFSFRSSQMLLHRWTRRRRFIYTYTVMIKSKALICTCFSEFVFCQHARVREPSLLPSIMCAVRCVSAPTEDGHTQKWRGWWQSQISL